MVNRWDPIGTRSTPIDVEAMLEFDSAPTATSDNATSRAASRAKESDVRLSYFEGREVSSSALVKRYGIDDRAALRALAFEAAALNTRFVRDRHRLVSLVQSQIRGAPNTFEPFDASRERQARRVISLDRRRTNETAVRHLPPVGHPGSHLAMAALQQLWDLSEGGLFPPRASPNVDRRRTTARSNELRRQHVDRLCGRTIAYLTDVWNNAPVAAIASQPVYLKLVERVRADFRGALSSGAPAYASPQRKYVTALRELVDIGRSRLAGSDAANESGWHVEFLDLQLTLDAFDNCADRTRFARLTSWLDVRGVAAPSSLDRVSLLARFLTHPSISRDCRNANNQQLVEIARTELLEVDPIALMSSTGSDLQVDILSTLGDDQLPRDVSQHVFWSLIDDEPCVQSGLFRERSFGLLVRSLVSSQSDDLGRSVAVLTRYSARLAELVAATPENSRARGVARSRAATELDGALGAALKAAYGSDLNSVPSTEMIKQLAENVRNAGGPRTEMLVHVLGGVLEVRSARDDQRDDVAIKNLLWIRSSVERLSDSDAKQVSPFVNIAIGFYFALRSFPPEYQALLLHTELQSHALNDRRSTGVESAACHLAEFASPETCRQMVSLLTDKLQACVPDRGRFDQHERVWKWASAALVFVHEHGDAHPHDLVAALNQHARRDTTGMIEGHLRRRGLFVEEVDPLLASQSSARADVAERPRLGRANVFRLAYERARRRLGNPYRQG